MASGGSGLASRTTPLSALAQSSSSSPSPKEGATATPSSSSPSASPSLAQLAANSNAPPRMSLASLATTSSTLRTPTSTTSSLAAAGVRVGSPSLSQLAGQGGAAAAPRRSLASLAQSSSSTTTTTATQTTAAIGGGSSLSQLANASNNTAPPRRSLVGLAASSSSTATGARTGSASTTESLSALSGAQLGAQPPGSPSTGRAGTAGLTLRSGGGLAGLSRAASGSGGLRKDTLDEPSVSTASSPSLADLAAGGRGVQATTGSLSELEAGRSSGSLGGLSRLAGSASSTTRPAHKLPVSGQVASNTAAAGAGGITAQETTMQPEDTSDFGHMSGEVIDYSYEDDSTSAASGFSSLIAPPSHFAISIFEKLEGVPSPLARSTATQIQADPAVRYGGYSVGVGGIGGVAVRTFAFDVPSPDDVVFKAQGHRPAVTRA